MRDDLEFLYKRARRSIDIQFVDEVAMLMVDEELSTDDINHTEKVYELMERVDYLETMILHPERVEERFDILIGDSQMGADWYRTR